MASQVKRIDQGAINALGSELVSLAQGVRSIWLGCERLLLELQAAAANDNPGTLRSLAEAVGPCLALHVSEEDG